MSETSEVLPLNTLTVLGLLELLDTCLPSINIEEETDLNHICKPTIAVIGGKTDLNHTCKPTIAVIGGETDLNHTCKPTIAVIGGKTDLNHTCKPTIAVFGLC